MYLLWGSDRDRGGGAVAPNLSNLVLDKMYPLGYNTQNMQFAVERTPNFAKWLKKLKDIRGKVRVNSAIDKMEEGDFGDSHDLKDGLWETRIHFGPGYRLYYVHQQGKIIILLCGGNKSTQKADLKKARKIRKEC